MRISGSRCLVACLVLIFTCASAQEGDTEKARGYIEKVVQGADSWVFQRSWRTHVRCPVLNGMVEKVLNMQIRKAMSGLPIQPPTVKVEYFKLSRKAGNMRLRVELGGMAPEMEKAAENEANKWLKTSPQARMLQSILSQPIGLPTFGRGGALKGTELKVHRDAEQAVDITITPAAGANVKILGKLVRNIAVRINKQQNTVQILQANFTDGAMVQVKYQHKAVKTEDNQTFYVPAMVTLKQKGLDKLGQGMGLPASTQMQYESFGVEGADGN